MNKLSANQWAEQLQWADGCPIKSLFDYVNYESNSKDNPQEVRLCDYMSLVNHPVLSHISSARGYNFLLGKFELLKRGYIDSIVIEAFEVWWEINEYE